jgi:hypothetical protein
MCFSHLAYGYGNHPRRSKGLPIVVEAASNKFENLILSVQSPFLMEIVSVFSQFLLCICFLHQKISFSKNMNLNLTKSLPSFLSFFFKRKPYMLCQVVFLYLLFTTIL